MTEQQYDNLKENYLKHIKRYMKEAGGLFPHITILADHLNETEDPKSAVIHIPIPDEYMENDEAKDEFIEDILPDIMKTVKEKFKPHAIAWTSEAWMRVADKDFNFNEHTYKLLPKKEVLFVSIETEDKQEHHIYEMKRTGMKVTDEGDLCDDIDLIQMEDSMSNAPLKGRFSGLYKKLINS